MTVFRAFSNQEVLDYLATQVTDGQVFTDEETLKNTLSVRG
ncbi:hypothetical protein RYX41_16600 [Lactiplantibacillus plantarum]|nr:hypothetical protein [Lactiplantibacillus plantarum]